MGTVCCSTAGPQRAILAVIGVIDYVDQSRRVDEMTSELWFYLTTVLICVGYALLMQSYPQWKVYFSIGLAGFIIGGAALVYFDAKEREEDRIKIVQMDRMLEDLKKEATQQESLAKDATDRARLLAEQLETKTQEMAKVLKEKPQIGGEIVRVGIFPWQRAKEQGC